MKNQTTIISFLMSEEFLQYLWQHQLIDKSELKTTDAQKLEIISPGTLNTNAGPDFENARLKIDGTIWAGNVEVHANSADWEQHKHHTNKAYNNVVLHVVANYKKPVFTESGISIPTYVLKFDERLFEKYEELKRTNKKIACSDDLNVVDSFIWKNWLDRLAVERLEGKTELIKGALAQNNNNWEESFYVVLSRSFGFKTNALPFEMLARLTPLKLVTKYRTNLMQLEALLFGQAGLLEEKPLDSYMEKLTNEYNYLRKIHSLKNVEKHLWKFMRLRPSNFPTIRIAEFTALIHQSSHLFSKIMETDDVKQLRALFECVPSKYWLRHYNFGKESTEKNKSLGKASVDSLLINTVIPFIFIYGQQRAGQEVSQRAIDFLEQLAAEKNSIITLWNNCDIKAANAFESQALIQLHNVYCIQKNCLYCHIGNAVIKQSLI